MGFSIFRMDGEWGVTRLLDGCTGDHSWGQGLVHELGVGCSFLCGAVGL